MPHCASRSSRRAYDDCPGQAATEPIRDCLVPPRLPARADPRETAYHGAFPSGHSRYRGRVCSVTGSGLLLQEARGSVIPGPLAIALKDDGVKDGSEATCRRIC